MGVIMIFRTVVASLLLSTTSVIAAAPTTMKQPGHWAQSYTGRLADPSVRFGTLPNGLRYAIMHNETPSDGVVMRMRIGAGSLQERDEERGLAHFIEHMAFRGSTNIADGEMVHMLERQGLSFGPDTNAFTAQDQTVYMFNFPKSDPTALDTGLKLFREIGERLNLQPAAIEAEKGVVLSEERLRDTPQYRTVKSSLSTLLDGTRLIDRWPIGTVETIKGANRDRLARYYRANYRPDNATIVIVGNVDPAAVEQQVRSSFADWKAAGTPDKIALGIPSGKKPVGEYVAPGAPEQLAMVWVAPDDQRADTEAVEREYLVRLVGLTVLNQRLADFAAKPGSPFIAAQAVNLPSVLHSGGFTQIGISAPADKWQAALDATSTEQRMLLRDGVQPSELQRAISSVRTQLEAKAAQSSTRTSQAIADNIVAAAGSDAVYTSDAQDVALASPILAGLSTAEVNAALKSLFLASHPLLFRAAQQGEVGPARLATALSNALAKQIGAEVKQAAIEWPYSTFGSPSAIVSHTTDAQLGVTTVRFANGTRLLVKPTKYEKDRIRVAVVFGNGRAGVPPELARALWQAQIFPLSGTGKLPVGDIQKWTQSTGKVVSVALNAGNRSFALLGNTRPEDLAAQMELLAAYVRDPGFRPEGVEKAKALAPMFGGQLEANADAVYLRGSQSLMVGNDQRFAALPSAADLSKVETTDLPSLLKPSLGGKADVVMVGDVSIEDAIKATQATFGAGPVRQTTLLPAPKIDIAVIARPVIFAHKGRADQAFYGEYFKLPDYFAEPEIAAVADVAAALLSTRLVDTVREKLGITYSPMVSALSSTELRGQGYFSAAIETPENNFGAFHSILAAQLGDLATKPISDDELARAKQPLVQTQRKQLETNDFWLAKLTESTREPRIREQAVQELGQLEAVTTNEVRAFAAKYLAAHAPIVTIAKAAVSGDSIKSTATNK